MRSALLALLLTASALPALAAGSKSKIDDVTFPHEGPFGAYDQNQLQRGLQVYTEVCSACHGLKYVPLRTLSDEGGPGLPEDQVRAYASQYSIVDAETGEDRERTPTDPFPESGMEGAPDLSLITKSRKGFEGPYGTGMSQLFNGMGGPEYVYSLLTHYEDNPSCAPEGIDGFYYNSAFPNGGVPDSCKDENGVSTIPGSWIAMPSPLSEDLLTSSPP